MAQTGRLLRWLFGINAILFGGIWLRHLWIWDGAMRSVGRLAGYAAIATVYGTAFLMLNKGGKRARYWGLAASALNVPFYWIVQPAWIWTAAGLLGLIVFWRQATVDQMGAKAGRAAPTRGGG